MANTADISRLVHHISHAMASVLSAMLLSTRACSALLVLWIARSILIRATGLVKNLNLRVEVHEVIGIVHQGLCAALLLIRCPLYRFS